MPKPVPHEEIMRSPIRISSDSKPESDVPSSAFAPLREIAPLSFCEGALAPYQRASSVGFCCLVSFDDVAHFAKQKGQQVRTKGLLFSSTSSSSRDVKGFF
jgi:hypothetical protein